MQPERIIGHDIGAHALIACQHVDVHALWAICESGIGIQLYCLAGGPASLTGHGGHPLGRSGW